MNLCCSGFLPKVHSANPKVQNFTSFYAFMLQVRDCVIQRVYELLRGWWLEGIEEKTVEKTKDNRTAANASKKNCGI